MNEQDKAELESLKRRQETIRAELASLDASIQRLAARLDADAIRATPEFDSLATTPAVGEEAIGHAIETKSSIVPSPSTVLPPPLPPVLPVETMHHTLATTHFEPNEEAAASQPLSAEPAPSESATRPPPLPRETFEMKLGTYWLVRVGIVMLLTGLVFLGTYAYKNYIGKLGPAGKVTLLYAAGAALLGFGGWLQRKREKESLRNYGQVLFAGGLAAVYFTTYAAHYVPVLRVIGSAVVDALLLLAWSAVIVWIADHRKSEVLALFAIGLSYYTSAITDVGLFTLYSNLVLTAATVFFLIRNRWTTLSFISVLATYGGFAFWRFHQGDWSWAARETELWRGNFFLAGYWLFFTAAVFFARGKSLAHASRALFASLNNGAFFALVVFSMFHYSHGYFWKFSLGFGVALLVAALLARRILSDEAVVKNAYLVQGLTLVTVGFIAYFSGLKLALVLAAESVALTFLGRQQGNRVVSAGGYATAALSAVWVLTAMTGSNADVLIGSVIGVGFLLNAWWEQRHDEQRASSVVRPFSGYFVALAIGVCAIVTWHAVPEPWRAVAWMIEAVVLTALFYAVRIPELPLFSQALALAAQGFWFFEFALRNNRPHWVVPATLVGGTLALGHWWQRQGRLELQAHVRNVLQIVYALALVATVFFWLKPSFGPAAWLAFLCLLAIGLAVYGVMTRAWALAACSQVFLLISSVEFFQQFLAEKPSWRFAVIPVATWLALGVATTAYLSRFGGNTKDTVRRPLLQASMFYRAVAFLMSLWWIFGYVPVRNHFWVLCTVGIVLLVLAGGLRNREILAYSGLYLIVAFATWFAKVAVDTSVVTWGNLFAMLSIFGAQQFTRRLSQRYAVPQHTGAAAILITGIALWTFVSRWVVLSSGTHFLLTVSWAVLAAVLFTAGFVLRERMYRWLGLGILACAVGRVFVSDVWKLETIYRILSFMALGIVLLALGFIYNKYQEKIRQWL